MEGISFSQDSRLFGVDFDPKKDLEKIHPLDRAIIQKLVEAHLGGTSHEIDGSPLILIADLPVTFPLPLDPGAEDPLTLAGQAVGRIETSYPNGDGFQISGTAWLLRKNIAVTSRHVALNLRSGFTSSLGELPAFRTNVFGEEPIVELRLPTEVLRVKSVLWVEPLDEDTLSPDIALLELEKDASVAPLVIGKLGADMEIAVIQYPVVAAPGSKPLQNPGRQHFAPGKVLRFDSAQKTLDHTATTYGGSSGGPIVARSSGVVVGMHSGSNLDPSNRGVMADIIEQRTKWLDWT